MSDIDKLRDALFATLEGVKDGTIDIEKAKAITDVSQTIINTAKAEIDFARVNGSVDSKFFAKPTMSGAPAITQEKEVRTLVNGATVVVDGASTTHKIN